MRFSDIPSQIFVSMARGSARSNPIHPACPLFSQLFACTINNSRMLEETSDGSRSLGGRIRGSRFAGAFTFSDGLRMVAKRGEIMSQVSGGGMAAVIALEAAEFRKCLPVMDLRE